VNKTLNILVVESSSLVIEGLTGILAKSGLSVHITHSVNIQDAEKFLISNKYNIAIINPSYIQNNLKAFNILKGDYPDIYWVSLIYAYYDAFLISQFDAVINISDTPENIIITLKNSLNTEAGSEAAQIGESLSDRENEVLQLLATGFSNKEIADKLNISINTVITHRKNITQKTGIKSISGLTIYAVVKKLISLDNIQG
jgi:DNA-binding NarL/FixJ family response regulator